MEIGPLPAISQFLALSALSWEDQLERLNHDIAVNAGINVRVCCGPLLGCLKRRKVGYHETTGISGGTRLLRIYGRVWPCNQETTLVPEVCKPTDVSLSSTLPR
jgi:hypothetical protein